MAVPAIGIDLGTTYSCVGVFQYGRVEILTNDQGYRITSSCVAFNDNEILIGDPAKGQAATNTSNTVFEAKRLIGRGFNDQYVQSDMKNWPFQVINYGGKPKIKVEYKGENKIFDPREISSRVLRKMKEIAEGFLGEAVTNAVITIPAYFNDSQRHATKDAGTIAGLNVLRIINEPTAAAIAYGIGKEIGKRNVLIYDLGGGTFDVSLLTIEGNKFKVIAIDGDTHLGGGDFDNRMVDHFVQEFERKHKKDLSLNKQAKQILKIQCEIAKRNLSSSKQANIEIKNLVEGIDFSSTISRARFEYLNADFFQRTIDCVEKVLNDANLGKDQVHDIVLVGGSTRIPKIQELLKVCFPDNDLNKNLKRNINADEAVAYGATVLAAILNDNKHVPFPDAVVQDVTPLSLGVEIVGDKTFVIIKRCTSIPTKQTQNFTTVYDNQTSVRVEVYEGEHSMIKDNNLLGKFILSGIPPAPMNVPSIEITFEIDVNGILHVSAVEKSTRNENSMIITNDRGRLSKEEIENMIKDAEKDKDEDEKQKKRIDAKNSLENYALYIKSTIQFGSFRSKISEEGKRKLLIKIEETFSWINKTQLAEKEQFDNRYNELKTVFKSIIKDDC